MRKASDNYGFFMDGDVFVGVSLGYDYCAEHEWGIKRMKNLFGIPEPTKKNMGIKGRTITTCDENALVFMEETHKKNKFAILYTRNRYSEIANIPYDLKDYKDSISWRLKYDEERNTEPERRKDPIATAWDEGSFGIGVMGEKEILWLKELHEAFLNKNVVIAFTSMPNNPFTGTSLCLLIADRVPEELSSKMYLADKEFYDREDYEKKIGMKKIIEKYGNKNGYKKDKYFCACSPKWVNYNNEEAREATKKKMNTQYDIMYWINYSDADDNFGWYTVEEIKEWFTGNKKLVEIRKG